MSTLIECKLIREGGTFAEVGGTEYHFKPYTDGAHVCVVPDDDHAERFLEIREGYRLYRGDGKPVKGAEPVAIAKAEQPVPTVDQAQEVSPIQSQEVDDRETLAIEYESLYGKRPHHKVTIEKLRELIAAKK